MSSPVMEALRRQLRERPLAGLPFVVLLLQHCRREPAAARPRWGRCQRRSYARHRHQEFLRFLQLIAATHRRGQIHLVLDNCHTHKHPPVKDWLAHHVRFHLHFTPTSASWLNQVEGWFSLLQRRAIRRGVFRSVSVLRAAIQRFLDAWNEQAHPFSWTKTADQF